MTGRRVALEDAELLKLLYYLRLSRAVEGRLSILIRQGEPEDDEQRQGDGR
jgi:hypothetical protein